MFRLPRGSTCQFKMGEYNNSSILREHPTACSVVCPTATAELSCAVTSDVCIAEGKAQRISSAVSVANPLQRRVRKGLPPMERKTGTASTDEKEALRIAKSDEAKRHDNHAQKEQQQRCYAPRKKAALCTENRKNKPLRYERRTSPVQREKCFRWYDF